MIQVLAYMRLLRFTRSDSGMTLKARSSQEQKWLLFKIHDSKFKILNFEL